MKNMYIFLILWLSCCIGSLAILPYLTMLTSFSLLQMLMFLVQNAIIYALVIWLGLKLTKNNGFSLLLLSNNHAKLKNILVVGLCSGLIVGCCIIGLDFFVFKYSTPQIATAPSPFYGLLASFYGAVNEEVFNRLFFLSLFVWIFKKITRFNIAIWISLVITSIIFGVGHLPAAIAVYGSLTAMIVARILILNGIPGIVFGYLFWKKGFECAVIAHFTADIVLHVLMPIFK